jgi:hypothetical protein
VSEPGLALLLRDLEQVERTGERRWPNWKALCPCHEDHTPSLNIDYRVPSRLDPDLDDPKPMVHCRICEANLLDVCKVVGLPIGRVMLYNDQWDELVMGEPPPAARLPSLRRLLAWRRTLCALPERLAYLHNARGLTTDTIRRYCIGWDFHRYTVPIRDDDGSSVVNLRRYLPGGEPKWVGLAGRSVKHLYPNFPTTTTVLLVEGELDALIARQHSLPAVTCVGGVGTWDENWNRLFAGRRVAIIYDCDEAGRTHARRRQAEVRGVAASVKVIDLGLQDKEDLTDWFVTYSRSADDLRALIRRTPVTGNEALNSRRIRPRTERKQKAPATERQPGLSSSPQDKEKSA